MKPDRVFTPVLEGSAQSTVRSNREERTRVEKVIRPTLFSPSTLIRGLPDLCRYKDLLYTLTVLRFSIRYKQSVLGWVWAFFQPLALMMIYTLIFSFVVRLPSEGVPYSIFSFSALLPWTFFASSVTTSTTGLISYGNLLSKVYFPREIILFSYILAALFDFFCASFVLGGMMIYYHVTLTLNAVFAVPIILLLFLFASGIALLLSSLNVRFRDVGMAMPLLLQVWMFATPIIYPISAVPKSLRAFSALNPLAGLIENFRRTVVQGLPPDAHLLGSAALGSAIAFVLAYMVFKQLESTFADVI